MENGTYITPDERAEKANVPRYAVYQIKNGDKYRDMRFTDWSDLKRFNIPFDKENYEAVYGGYVSDVSKNPNPKAVIEDFFVKFNIDRPEDFRGHSLSVSDVVTIEDKNGSSAFYVDSLGMADVTDLFFDIERQKIDLSKLSEITLKEEYDRRKDQPDDFLHIKNTVTFSNLNSSYLISRYKEFTYEYDDMPDLDEGYTFTTKQGMLDEVREFLEDTRNDSTKSISVTDMNGNTNVLEGMLFEFEATEDRLAFMLPGVGYAEMFERDDDGYDYTFYDKDFKVTDSGVYDDVSITIRQAFANVLEDAGFDIAKCEPMDFEEVHDMAEQAEKTAEPHTLAVGDIFRDKSGTKWEVTSLTGVLPFYTDDCTIKGDNGSYIVEKNISKSELLDGDKYELVKAEKEAPVKTEKSEYVPKIGDLIDINDELLSISDISGSTITFTDTATLFGNTSRMDLAEFLASDFTGVEETESEAIQDVPVEHFENIPTADVPPEHFEGEVSEETVNVPPEHQTSNGKNFVITDENLGVKTPKARFAANIEAIRTLNAIETEHRTATPEEQTILSGYTGWGAIPQAFDPDNKEWKSEYAQLKNLLTDEEYSAARRSTMNAHYTSPVVINAIYEGLKNIGFEKGKILEPAMGIGNFFGAMPEAMRGSKLHGVELDSLTGRIAKQLYPDAYIQIKGFEKTNFANDSFDAAVGNVSFGDYRIDDKDYNKHKFLIHDYFVAKSIDKIRPGGVIAVVTAKGTILRTSSPIWRELSPRRWGLLLCCSCLTGGSDLRALFQ